MDPSTPVTPPPTNPEPPVAPQQPAPLTPTPAPVTTPAQPTAAQDPGKGLGIAGFVLAFTGTQLIGLILSIIGFKKSKKAGFKNTLAFAGIILNSIFIGLAIILIPIFVATTLVSYNGISARANTSSAKSTASTVLKYAERYAAENGTYPTSFSQTGVQSSGSSVTLSPSTLVIEPSTPYTIEFSVCGTEGNKVGYWDYTERTPAYVYTGTATSSSDCTISKN